jgi:FMN phosphatase YigB (HAD superfamily)
MAQSSKKRSKTGIRFVYFDVNGCLVRFFHRAFTNIANDTGASTDVIETCFWHYNDAVCRGELTTEEFSQLLAERIGQAELDWPKYYLDAVDPIPEMHAVIAWVAENYHLGLLTNIMPGLLDALRQRGLVPQVNYDTIIDSSAVGAIKPEPKIYELAQERAHVEPHEILLVDDSRTNLMAAERMGWHVLWFDDFHPEESIARIKASLEPEQSTMPEPAVRPPSPPPERNLY